MGLNSRWFIRVIALLVMLPPITCATAIITHTRTEVAQMACWWEGDSIQISGLANAQYPQIAPSARTSRRVVIT